MTNRDSDVRHPRHPYSLNHVVVNHGRHPLRGLVLLLTALSTGSRTHPWLYASTPSGLRAPLGRNLREAVARKETAAREGERKERDAHSTCFLRSC